MVPPTEKGPARRAKPDGDDVQAEKGEPAGKGRGPRVAALGPEGTFSDRAAMRRFPDAEMVYCDDFDGVFQAVEEGSTEFGLAPLENSLEGAVGRTMDLLLAARGAAIVGEAVEPVHHCLLGRGDPTRIRVILSHPQALAQCRRYLKDHYPKAELRTTGSTSHAARLAQEFPEMAAVASGAVAERYGLEVIHRDIQDSEVNATRFAVLGKERPGPTGRDKTSLAVYLERDRPGALYELLGEFADRKINLTRIESRPSRQSLGDYYFFIDIEGHVEDTVVKAALEGIKAKATEIKVLGSYPRA